MKLHVKIYMEFFDYGETDFMPCEICGQKLNDIHHIERRGMGGTRKPDVIGNLMGLCRVCHTDFGDVVAHKEKLKEVHLKFMKYNGKKQ